MTSLDDCSCGASTGTTVPAPISNRPGLSALDRRVGTHGAFLDAMRASLGRQPALVDLTTRTTEDPGIALLDAWATVLDILAFYQERIADEGYLRTATERRSVLALARRIGYELRPGVAASTSLAFTLQTGPGAPTSAVVRTGTRAQTVPGQDELPQTFETVEDLRALAAWQDLRPRQSAPFEPVLGTPDIWLDGVDNDLTKGDGLLLVGQDRIDEPGSERWDFRRVRRVAFDRERDLTHVTFDRSLGSTIPRVEPAVDPTVYAFRRRTSLFGANAPDWDAMPAEVRLRYDPDGDDRSDSSAEDWPGLSISRISGITEEDFDDGPVHLAAVHAEVVPGSWVVLSRPGYAELYAVDEVIEDSRSLFTLSAQTTRLLLVGENLQAKFDDHVRDTVAFVASERLHRAELPLDVPVAGDQVLLDGPVEGLVAGQRVSIDGIHVVTGEPVAEVATIAFVDQVEGATRLTFTGGLEHSYVRRDGNGIRGARLNANVAPATHGTTVTDEVLGSGDGSVGFQRFGLTHLPLTHVTAATASGVASTLEVRVDGVRWDEVPSLYGQPPDARVHVTRRDDDGTVTVQFGDGRSGARLPTGVENVRATYRHGIGLGGHVAAGQISLLMTRPLGVKDVTNPEAPSGADDPETLDAARDHAPLTVLTLDRIVSVRDVEDFAAAFAGVGAARADVLWSGEDRLVHLTVAAADGSRIPDDAELIGNLRAAIDAARADGPDVVVQAHDALGFTLTGTVEVEPTRVAEDVEAAVRAALVTAFSFPARRFAQGVTTSEVLAAMQAVPGVVAVDLDGLDGRDPFVHSRLDARPARWEGGVLRAAELLLLDPSGVELTVVSS